MWLQSIFATIWQPMKAQLSLFRALTTGGRIPGTNAILMPVAADKSRFGLMEHLMMILAGTWLMFRVIFRDLTVGELEPKRQKPSSSIALIKDTDSNKDTDVSSDSDTTTSCCTTSEANLSDPIDTDTMDEGSEELFYWGCNGECKEEPLIQFTRAQLDVLLRLDPDDEQADDIDNDDDSTSTHNTIHSNLQSEDVS